MLGGGKTRFVKDNLSRVGSGRDRVLFHSVGGKSGQVTIIKLADATCAIGVGDAVS